MSTVNLECRDSFNVFPGGKEAGTADGILLLCRESGICLRFELPVCLTAREVQRARLVLFKIPRRPDSPGPAGGRRGRYAAFPLRGDATPFGGAFAPPRVDRRRAVRFRDRPRRGYTEIDVTAIVRAWANGAVVNRGFWLTGCRGARPVTYASGRNPTPGVRPLLRLCVETRPWGFCPPLAAAPCTVRVETGTARG